MAEWLGSGLQIRVPGFEFRSRLQSERSGIQFCGITTIKASGPTADATTHELRL